MYIVRLNILIVISDDMVASMAIILLVFIENFKIVLRTTITVNTNLYNLKDI